MILTCPECKTRFVVKDDAIGPNGRTVRCSKCSTTWFVAGDPEVLELEDNKQSDLVESKPAKTDPSQYDPRTDDYDHEDIPSGEKADPEPDVSKSFSAHEDPSPHTQIRARAERKKVHRRLMGVGMIWGMTLLILSLMIAAGFLLRSQIVEKLPGAEHIYKAFGIEVTASGLEIYDIKPEFGENNGVPVMFVSGYIRNYDLRRRNVGAIELTFKNANGEAIGRWTIDPPNPTLEPGKSMKFMAQYPEPPIDAVKLGATFIREGQTP